MPSDCHAKIQALYEYWQRRRGTRRIPSRSDIDPLDVPVLLPHLFLIDVPLAGWPLTYRLAGTAVAALFGQELTGQAVGEGTLNDYRDEVHVRYAAIIASQRPFYHQARLRERTNDFTDIERLILPLSDDEKRVNMLLGMVVRRGEGD
ncbi:MAG: PAS domain-containing protein [Rhodospirillales bacterium]|nr:PAS domain-containing protein [Rhodospirillales bacterium]